jgi:hypothetical protein
MLIDERHMYMSHDLSAVYRNAPVLQLRLLLKLIFFLIDLLQVWLTPFIYSF